MIDGKAENVKQEFGIQVRVRLALSRNSPGLLCQSARLAFRFHETLPAGFASKRHFALQVEKRPELKPPKQQARREAGLFERS